MEQQRVSGAEGGLEFKAQAPFLSGFANLLRCGTDYGQFAEVLGGGGEEELVICAAWATHSDPAWPNNPFEVGEERLDLLSELH